MMRQFYKALGCGLVLSVLSVAVLAAPAVHKKKAAQANVEKKTGSLVVASHALPAFDRIQAGSNMIIQIQGQHKTNQLRIVKSPKDARNVVYRVKNKTLYLEVKGKSRGRMQPVRVGIDMGLLKSVGFSGNTSVYSQNLTSDQLNIDDNASGVFQLHGQLDIRSIKVGGHANVDVQWVLNKSDITVTAGGDSRVRLAGVANKLHIKLSGRAEFSGQFLRAKDVWVKTTGLSRAHVMAEDSLRAFASGRSDIYYYKVPGLLTKNTIESGNVFQAGWQR